MLPTMALELLFWLYKQSENLAFEGSIKHPAPPEETEVHAGIDNEAASFS